MATGAPGRESLRRLAASPWTVLLVGLGIREGFSFWTGHPYDFESWIRTGHAVASGQNPYLSFWPPVPGVSFAFLDQQLPSAAYPPLWPALSGLIYLLWEHVGGGNRFVLYFLLKQPLILADVATAVLLGRLAARWTGDAVTGRRARDFWLLFPYAIVISAIWGQIDALVVVILLALLTLPDAGRRTVAEGVGVFAKWFTAIFLPLELFRQRGRARLWALGVLAVPLALTGATFVLLRWPLEGFQGTTTSQTQGGGGGMNLAMLLQNPQIYADVVAVPHLYTAITYLWVPAIVLGGLLASRWLREPTPRQELRALMFVTTLFLALRFGLYEQYMLYIFSLLYLDVAAFHPGRARLLGVLVVLASLYLIVNNDLGIWFASPLSPGAFSYAVALDQGSWQGGLRADVLVALAVLVTLTLAQLTYAIYRDDPRPNPWLWPRFRELRSGGSGPTAPA